MTLTAEQHQSRSRGLGGSDAAAALGLSKYKTPVKLYLEKIGEIDDEDATEGPLYWGGVLEDIVATEYVKRTGNKVRRRRDAFVHPEHDFMLAHIDRSVDGQRKVLECKTSTDWLADKWGPSGSDDVPDDYLVQVQHQLACTGYDRADLAVLIGNRDFRIYHLGADASLIDAMIEREYAFWQCVLTRTPPDPVNLQDLSDLYPVDSGSQLLASDEIDDKVSELVRVRSQIKQLDEQKQEIEQAIKTAMADAAELVNDEGRKLITWKTAKPSKRLDAKALQKAEPDVYERFVVEQPGNRRFLVKA